VNTGILVLNTAFCVLFLVIAWLMPALTQRTLPFGVRVPAQYATSPLIAERRTAYRRWIVLAGGLVLLVGVVLSVVFGVWFGPIMQLVAIAVVAPGYVHARRAIQAAKQRENWFAGLRQGIATDTSLRSDPERFPWLWAVPALLVLLFTAALGIARYPDLPPMLAVHFNSAGDVDRVVPKSVGAAFTAVFVQAGVTALILVLTSLSFRSRPDIDAAAPVASARRGRVFVQRMARGLLVVAACVNVTLLLATAQIWEIIHTRSVLLLVLPVVVGVLVLLGFAVGIRQPESADENTGMVQRDDDEHWHAAAMFYVNRDDPALFVPKRFGIGWTVNLGNPRAILLLAGLVAVVILLPILLV
jgi:uncharacterized membrane protein